MTDAPHLSPPLAPDEDCQPLQLTLPESFTPDGLGPLPEVAAQLPDASELSPGTWLAVCDAAEMKRKGWGTGGWGRLWHRDQPPRIHLAARCTALLLRGYAGVCADAQGVAYGRVPDATDARSS